MIELAVVAQEQPWCTDEQLVQQVRTGSKEATEALLLRHRWLVVSRARSYFLIGAEPPDLVQEGMVGLLKAIRDYRQHYSVPFRMFADLCIRRQVITAIKAANRAKHVPLNTYVSVHKPLFGEGDSRLLDEVLPSVERGPEETVVEHESLREMISQLTAVLSPYERHVLVRYLDGLSYASIAQALGTSLKSVDNAVWRVKRKARRSRINYAS